MRDGTTTMALKNTLNQRITHFSDALGKLGEFSKDASLTEKERETVETVRKTVSDALAPLEAMLTELSSVSTRCAYCGENVSYDGKKYTCANCGKSYVLSVWREKVGKQ